MKNVCIYQNKRTTEYVTVLHHGKMQINDDLEASITYQCNRTLEVFTLPIAEFYRQFALVTLVAIK